jgi:hypothetical protein
MIGGDAEAALRDEYDRSRDSSLIGDGHNSWCRESHELSGVDTGSDVARDNGDVGDVDVNEENV